MHKYKIKRNHKQKLRYKFQFIHKNRNTLNNLAQFYANPPMRIAFSRKFRKNGSRS